MASEKEKLERKNLADFLEQKSPPTVTCKQIYEALRERLLMLREQLDSIASEEQAHDALDATEQMINSLLQSQTVANDAKLSDLIGDGNGYIFCVRCHYVGMSILCNFVDRLIDAIDEII